jgi:hypothetical protein
MSGTVFLAGRAAGAGLPRTPPALGVPAQLTCDPRGAVMSAADDGAQHGHVLNGEDEVMKEGTGRSRSRRRAGPWRAGVLAAVAGTAVLAGACGGGGGGLSAVAGPGACQKALACAQCMRSHGVPGWPGPNSRGSFLIRHIDMGSPVVQAADNACRHLLPNDGRMTAAQRQQALLKFSACMRTRAAGLPGSCRA